jgi:hypothetical protein
MPLYWKCANIDRLQPTPQKKKKKGASSPCKQEQKASYTFFFNLPHKAIRSTKKSFKIHDGNQTSKNYPGEAPEGDSNGDRSAMCDAGDHSLEN